MRRSICLSEPAMAVAGQVNHWKFSFTTAMPIPKGASLKFDLLNRGIPTDWELPQTNTKVKNNLIWAQVEGKLIPAEIIPIRGKIPSAFEFVLPTELKTGETIHIYLGSPERKENAGNQAQTMSQRRRAFHLYIDPKGKREYKEPEIFTIDVRGNRLHNIRIIAPSVVAKNRRFDVMVRFEDEFGNLTNQAPEGTLIELSYQQLRENLNWKLFVPETGFIVLPNLYFNEPGLYTIQLLNHQNQKKYYSTPIKCFAEFDQSLYWGMFHGESERVDASENIEICLRHMRDEKSLQFFAVSPFENIEETSQEDWKLISQQIVEYNEENRFITSLGCQWMGEPKEEGLRQFLYWKDLKPILRKKDIKSNFLKKIYKSHSPKDLLSIPCFTMAKGFEYDFTQFTPEFERVVEIYNAWGCSECTEKEGNLRPIQSKDKKGISETEVGSIRAALNQNHRFGFVAGGLDDRGIYQGLYESQQTQYSPGLTAIYALEHTRDTLLQSLHNRSCYATTGSRMVLGFSIAGIRMGSELSTKTKPGLIFNRHITAFVYGTAPIEEILLVRNGKPFKSFHPNKSEYELVFDDTENLSQIILPSSDERPPFVYYYIRILQTDGHIGWSSPIWIDYLETKPTTMIKKIKK